MNRNANGTAASASTPSSEARDLAALEETRAQLQQALTGDRHISMAVGILMAQRGLAETAAFNELRNVARKERRKLEESKVPQQAYVYYNNP